MSWLDTLEQIRSRDFSKAKAAEREASARDVVNMSSYAVAVVAISPLPFSDAVLMLPLQSAMVLTVGHIYGRRVKRAEAKDLVVELGTLAGASFLARQGVKVLLPVFGGLLTVPAAFAANWAIGRVAMEYFRNPAVSKASLKELYKEAIREGKAKFSRADFERFRKKNGQSVQETIEEEQAPRERSSGKAAAKKKRSVRTAAKPTNGGARQLIEIELPKRIAKNVALAKEINQVIHVELSGSGGGEWTVDLTRRSEWVREGLHGTPAMTARAKATDFLKVGTGKLPANEALMSGALELDPLDLELAGKFGKLLA